MNSPIIYVNDHIFDLKPDQKVALTLKFFDFLNPTTRYANYTNKFKGGFTENNNLIFGISKEVKSGSTKPYRVARGKIVVNGIELFSNYTVILNKIDDGYNLSFFDNKISFFDALKNKTLQNLSLEDNLVLSNVNISARRNTITLSARSPLMDYGRLQEPQQNISNPSFSEGSLDPWTNTGTGVDWTYSAPGANIVLDETNFLSKGLNQPIQIFSGVQFTCYVNLTITTIDAPITFRVYMVLENGTRVLADSNPYNSTGDKVLTFSETPAQEYVAIEFEIEATEDISPLDYDITVTQFDIVFSERNIEMVSSFNFFGYSYKDIIDEIINFSGYSNGIDWDAISNNDPTFDYAKRLMTTFGSEWAYPDIYCRSRSAEANADGTQVISLDNTSAVHDIEFTDIVFNGDSEYYDGVSKYNFNALHSVYVSYYIEVNVTIVITSSAVCKFYLLNSPAVSVLENASTTTTVRFLKTEFSSTTGNAIQLLVTNSALTGSATVTVNSGKFIVTMLPKLTSLINWGALMPDIDLTDFFKDFLIRFFGIPYESDGVLYITTFNKILTSSNVLDWTTKRAMPDEIIEFSLPMFQNTILKNGDEFFNEESIFQIDNDTLQETGVLYTSVFEEPQTTIINGLELIRVPVYNDESETDGDFDNDPKMCLVYLRDRLTSDPTVEYGGSVVTDYKVAEKVTWNYLLETYWNNYIQTIQKFKKVTRLYNLNEIDIKNVTPFTKIYDNGEEFLIDRINSFVPGRLTKVDLVKI